MIHVTVHFYSYFKELAEGHTSVKQTLPAEATVEFLLHQLFARFPKLAPMEKSMLVAVGVEYQLRNYPLHDGEEISLFPPVQGG